MSEPELRLFTRVKISAEGVPSCIGRIEEIRPVEDPPDLDSLPADMARSILQEWGVTRVAMISYHADPYTEYMVAVVEMGGSWFDLRRQELVLEVVGQNVLPGPALPPATRII